MRRLLTGMSTTLPKLLPLATPQDWALNYNAANDPNAVGIEQPLAGARPNTSPTTNSNPFAGWLSDQNPLSQGLKNFGNSMQSAAATTLSLGGTSFGVVDIVAILAGLLLLGGAIFGFSSVRETTINVAKKGAEVAAL